MRKIPVASEAKRILYPSLAVFFISFLSGIKALSVLSFLIAIFVVYFFRDPERSTDLDENFIVSPADGKVLRVEAGDYGEFGKEKCIIVSIFMSPFDVHVNRSPTTAEIKALKYERGKFKSALRSGVEKKNERNYILMMSEDKKILVVQIAGFLARRIFCYLKEGMRVKRGERIGMIALGSRVDVFIPANYEIFVRKGQKVVAGVTPLAKKGG